jgi:hypothetical protein
VESDGGRGLEELAVEGRKNADNIVGTRRRLYDAGTAGISNWPRNRAARNLLLIDSFHELPYNERHTLNPLDLLLCPYQLSLQAPLLILDIFLLEVDISSQRQRHEAVARFRIRTLIVAGAF